MDELSGIINTKENILAQVKEILSRGVVEIEGNKKYFNIENNDHTSYALFHSIKRIICITIGEQLSNEIKCFNEIGYNYNKLAVCASAKKLLALPEMISGILELKQRLDEILESYSCAEQFSTVDSGQIQVEINSNEFDFGSGNAALNLGNLNEDSAKRTIRNLRERNYYTKEVLLFKLNRASLTEVFETPCWTKVKVMLRKCLSDDSKSVFFPALKLHARFLVSSSNVAMYESFRNLKISIMDQLLNCRFRNDLPIIKEGIILSKLSHVRLLKIMNLIVDFFRDGSKNYIRLPSQVIEEILDNMFELISFFPSDPANHVIHTYHLLSILDPKANWIKVCLYYTCIRIIAFKKLSKTPKIINYITINILSWINRLNVRDNLTNLGELDNVLSKRHIQFAAFSHSLHFYSSLMLFEHGRNIVWNMDGGVTSQEIFSSAVMYLHNSSTCQTAKLLRKLLSDMVNNPKNDLLTNYINILTINPLFQVYRDITRNKKSKEFPIIKPFIIHLISIMLQSRIGRDTFLLCKKLIFGKDTVEICPARILLLYSCNILQRLPGDGYGLNDLLTSCTLLSNSPKGLIEIEETNLIPFLSVIYKKLKGQNMIGDAKNMCSYPEVLLEENYLLEVVKNCILTIMSNSGRVWLINRESILFPILFDNYKQPVIPWHSCSFQKLVLSSTLMTGGCDAIAGEHIQCVPLINIWKSWHLDGSAAFLDWKEQVVNLQEELNKFYCLCSTLRGVKALLIEQEGSEVTLTEEINYPVSLQEALEITFGIFQDSSEKGFSSQDGFENRKVDKTYLGLTLLRFMMSSLDTNLFLQNKFLVKEHVMKIQNGNILEENGEIIVDEIIILCEQILGNSAVVDSGTERNFCIAKNTMSKYTGSTQLKSITSTSVSQLNMLPEEWLLRRSGHRRCHSRHTPRCLKNDLVKFLGNTRHGLRDSNWLNQLRRVHRSMFVGISSLEVKNTVLLEILEEVQKASVNYLFKSLKLQWSEQNMLPLFPEDLLGIKLAVRYGVTLGLLLPTPLVHQNFACFLKTTYGVMKFVRDEFWGFDWFSATVFLLCCGNTDRCQLFINNLVKLQIAPFLWSTYGESLSKVESFSSDYKNDFLFQLIQQVELILSIEVPKVFAAFQSSAASVAVLIQQWMCQCFWNILDWSEIKNFLCLAIINEPDYIVYFCVALLHHLESFILQILSTSTECFWEQIKITRVGNFRLGNYYSFIEKLSKTHHNNVLRRLSKCTIDFNKA